MKLKKPKKLNIKKDDDPLIKMNNGVTLNES